jgi:hypothetical protein
MGQQIPHFVRNDKNWFGNDKNSLGMTRTRSNGRELGWNDRNLLGGGFLAAAFAGGGARAT